MPRRPSAARHVRVSARSRNGFAVCALPHSSACTTHDDDDNNVQSREMVPVPTALVLLLSVKAKLRAKGSAGNMITDLPQGFSERVSSHLKIGEAVYGGIPADFAGALPTIFWTVPTIFP